MLETSIKILIFIVIVMSVSSFGLAESSWVGNFKLQISDTDEKPCQGHLQTWNDQDQIVFNNWARLKAAQVNLCFEVYQKGVTEYYRNDIDQFLQVELKSQSLFEEIVVLARYQEHQGNNAVYALNLRALDVFNPGMYYRGSYDILPITLSSLAYALSIEVSSFFGVYYHKAPDVLYLAP